MTIPEPVKIAFRTSSAVLSVIAVFLSFFLYDLALLYQEYSTEQILFHLVTPQENISSETVDDIVNDIIPKSLLMTAIFIFLAFFFKFYRILGLSVFLIGAIQSLLVIDFPSYLERIKSDSILYEDYYVHPEDENLQFPAQKQNLIFIYLESMETTFGDLLAGGRWHTNLIPNLTTLSQENVSFRDGFSPLGSGFMVTGTSWTVASIIGTTSGLPYKYPLFNATYEGDASFLPGATTIGDILYDAGYKQYFLLGSDGGYGSKDKYFSQHGDFEILDYYKAVETERIPSTYFENWGFEDQKVFEYAKEQLSVIGNQNQPFNYTILTADTHFPVGHPCPLCGDQYDLKIENVVACSDGQIYDFIQWVQQQDFYKNTTIVLLGDHLFMEDSYFSDQGITNAERRLYNCIINPVIQPEKSTNFRMISNLDFFPTTLAALGVTWDNPRLGLGTNLFTSSPTLIEELGLGIFNEELGLSSSYYTRHFFAP